MSDANGSGMLNSIVTSVLEQDSHRPWGHAQNFYNLFHGLARGEMIDSDRLRKLRSRLALAQLVQWMWARCLYLRGQDELSGNVEFSNSSINSHFLALLWKDIPCLVDAQGVDLLDAHLDHWRQNTPTEYASKSVKALRISGTAFLDMANHGVNVYAMPENLSSSHALLCENFWASLNFEIDGAAISRMLDSSVSTLQRIVSRAEEAGLRSPLQVNLDRVVEKFPLAQGVEGVEWFVSLNGMLSMMASRESFASLLRTFVPTMWSSFMSECEQAGRLPSDSLVTTVCVAGWLDRVGVLSHQGYLMPEAWAQQKISIIGSESQRTLERPYPITTEFFQALIWNVSQALPAEDALPMSAFSYLGQDATNLEVFARSKTPMRALLVGEGACGKTALALAAAKAANRKVCTPKSGSGENSVEWMCQVLRGLHQQSRLNDHALILMDPADKYLGGHIADNPLLVGLASSADRALLQTSEIWVVQNLKDLSPQMLHSFDLIVRMGPMPLANRVELASQHFQDRAMAVQVSQACSNAGEIQSLVKWKNATGQSDWASLSSRLTGIQQAILSTKETAGELPVSVHPPQVGHAGFADVVGQDGVVRQARRIIAGLRDPQRYKALKGKAPKGVLLTGGPGTGKTHLARAMAGEAGVPLLLADAAAMARSPALIAAVFAEARRQSPCLLFLDELDAIGTTARGAMGASPDPQRQAILNRLLTELDGFEGLDGVMVVGATHRSDLLDSALVRSGRLGLHLHLEDPTRTDREQLWRHYAGQVSCADVIGWERLGRISAGMSPADIAQAVNIATLRAAADEVDFVGHKHFVESIDEVLWQGDALELPMLDDVRWRTAVHEAGHALLAWRAGQEIERVSVRPRSIALGFVRTLTEEGRYGMLPNDVLSQLAMVYGGLAAETVVFGTHGTGVAGDLAQARRLVRTAVRTAGMSQELPAGLPAMYESNPSEDMLRQAETIEIAMLGKMRTKAIEWLTQQRGPLEALARHLVEQRELDGEEVHAWLEAHMDPNERRMLADVGQVEITQAANSWPAGQGQGALAATAATTQGDP